MSTTALRGNREWQRLLRHFELIEAPRHRVPGYLVLLVPDGRVAEACREDLEEVLRESGSKVQVVKPSNPEKLAEVAADLRQLAVGDDIGAVWLECVEGEWEEDFARWRAGWQKAAVGLNRSRDTLLRQIPVPILVVGAPWVMDVLIETAPDLWSVRTLVAEVSVPSTEAGIQEAVRGAEDEGSPTVDPEFALRQAERYRGVAGREWLFAELLTRAASGFRARGEGGKALPLVKEATDVIRGLDADTEDQKGSETQTLNELGVLNYRLGRLEDAITLWRRNEARSEELGDRTGLHRSYGNQAVILQAWGRLDEAMGLLKKKEEICEELGDRDGLQRTYGNQAHILRALGWLDEALAMHKKEEAIGEALGERAGLARSYANQARILRQMNRDSEAELLLRRALQMFTELEMPRQRDWVKRLLDALPLSER